MAALGSLVWSELVLAADPARGATVFQACAACHSTTPGEHMTGPSLAKIWQRKAGTVEGFHRYSEPMKHVDLVWSEATLDRWLVDPDRLIPGTSMTFQGLRESAPPAGQVTAISHCGDAYTVKTADGNVEKVWEFNLRFKTDSSELGPRSGKPVIVGAGMQGDRASVVFANPSEVSSFIKESCP